MDELREALRQIHARHDLGHKLGAWPNACGMCEFGRALATADKPLTGRDETVNLPFPTTDASKWAEEFCRMYPGSNEGLMLTGRIKLNPDGTCYYENYVQITVGQEEVAALRALAERPS